MHEKMPDLSWLKCQLDSKKKGRKKFTWTPPSPGSHGTRTELRLGRSTATGTCTPNPLAAVPAEGSAPLRPAPSSAPPLPSLFGRPASSPSSSSSRDRPRKPAIRRNSPMGEILAPPPPTKTKDSFACNCEVTL